MSEEYGLILLESEMNDIKQAISKDFLETTPGIKYAITAKRMDELLKIIPLYEAKGYVKYGDIHNLGGGYFTQMMINTNEQS